jgi:hypothetical protein
MMNTTKGAPSIQQPYSIIAHHPSQYVSFNQLSNLIQSVEIIMGKLDKRERDFTYVCHLEAFSEQLSIGSINLISREREFSNICSRETCIIPFLSQRGSALLDVATQTLQFIQSLDGANN